MTANASAARSGVRNARRPGSLTSPFLRHTLVFVGIAALFYVLSSALPADQQPVVWTAAAFVAGAVAALLAGGWVGLVFVPIAAGLGVLLELHLRAGPGHTAAAELEAAVPTLLSALAGLAVGYVVVLLLVGRLRRRR